MILHLLDHRLGKKAAAAVLLLSMVLALVPVGSVPVAQAAAGIYRPISYQGKVSTAAGVAIANGTYNMRFKIFTASTGGDPVWTETWNNSTTRVTMTGGLFTVLLGSKVTMTGSVNFNTDSLYLQVEFDPGNDGTYEEVFSPRRQFSAVPYAHNADQVDGLDSTQLLRNDTSQVASGTLTVRPRDASKTGIDIQSNAGAAAIAALKLSTQGANHIVFGTGASSYDTNLYRAAAARLRTDGSFYIGGTLSGAALAVMGQSNLLGNVAIGKSGTPTAKLDVVGTISGSALQTGAGGLVFPTSVSGFASTLTTLPASNLFRITGAASIIDMDQNGITLKGAGTTSNMLLVDGGSHILRSTVGAVERFRITGAGATNTTYFINTDVGIGKTSPSTKLDVVGTISGSALAISNPSGTNYMMGKLGLGTTTPGSRLTIYDSANTYNGQQIRIGSGPGFDYTMGRDVSTGFLTFSGSQVAFTGYSFLNGNMAIGKNTTAAAKLDVVGTISGSALTVSGLQDCSALKTSSIGAFSCAAGLTQTALDARYVNTSGDTMTGALVILKTSGTGTGNTLVVDTKGLVYDATNKRVGIGTAAPKAKLEVQGTISGSALRINGNASFGYRGAGATGWLTLNDTGGSNGSMQFAGIGSIDSTGDFFFRNNPATVVYMTVKATTGKIGIGTQSPTDLLTASGTIAIDADQTSTSANLFSITSNAGSTNNLVFRIQADGSSFSDNAHSTAGADYAEWFETAESDLKPGDIVCIDVTRANSVKKCSSDGDTNVMGIISTNPSVIGNAVKGKTITAEGFGRPGYALVGLIGQIPAKAVVESASGGVLEPIRPGDSLAAASKPGFVRRARAGESTVGVALEGLSSGEGTIKVLIARSNKSITTELMEEKVRSNIAALKIDDEIALSMQKSLEGLDLEKTVKDLTDADIVRLEETMESLKAQISALSGALVQSQRNITLSGSTVVEDLTANSTLTVVSDTRIGGDLYLEGSLKVSSIFVPGGMRVDGGMEVGGTLQADKIVAGSGSQITGLLKINEAILSSSGAALTADQLFVKGALEVLGDLTVRGIAKFFGPVEIHGELIVSAKQAGYARIQAGETQVTVVFASGGYVSTPVVTATPNSYVSSAWWTSKATATGFTVQLKEPATEDADFSWIAVGTFDPQTAMGESLPEPTVAFPIDSMGVPVSSNDVWNNCIRSIPTFDAEGQPFSCSRYNAGNEWHHPDLNITFVWNLHTAPPLLLLPEGYVPTVTQQAVPVMSSSSSEESSSSESSVSSESSEPSSSESSASSESSVSSSSESSVSSAASSSSETASESSASSEASSAESSAPVEEAPVETPVTE